MTIYNKGFLDLDDIQSCSTFDRPTFLDTYRLWIQLDQQSNPFKKQRIMRFLLDRKQQKPKLLMFNQPKRECVLQVSGEVVTIRSFPGFEKVMEFSEKDKGKEDKIYIQSLENTVQVKKVLVTVMNEQGAAEKTRSYLDSLKQRISHSSIQQFKLITILLFQWSDSQSLKQTFKQYKPQFITRLPDLKGKPLSVRFQNTDLAAKAYYQLLKAGTNKFDQKTVQEQVNKQKDVGKKVKIAYERLMCKRSELLKRKALCKQIEDEELRREAEQELAGSLRGLNSYIVEKCKDFSLFQD